MKIFILKVLPKFRPNTQKFVYPSHNRDYGVEQDFSKYLSRHPELLVEDPSQADWYYLPIYWTRWMLNHHYGQDNLADLQAEFDKTVINPSKTFTICQYDDGPLIKTLSTKLFLSSRKSKDGIDIPLLSSSHHYHWFLPPKIHLASFVGLASTHPLRRKMFQALSSLSEYSLIDGNLGTRPYVKLMLQSYVALCPRGYGGSSFRFYEAMQLGTVPFLIGDIDTRPFKSLLDWDSFSFYAKTPDQIPAILAQYSRPELLHMGRMAYLAWNNSLRYQKWCNLALKELE